MDELNIGELAAQERKEYFRTWRAANKEKTAKHRRNYWERRALTKLHAAQIGEIKSGVTNADNGKR